MTKIVIEEPVTEVSVTDESGNTSIVITDDSSPEVIEVGVEGPQGKPGRSGSGGGSATQTFAAGEDLSALRIVYAGDDGRVSYADKDDFESATRAVGMTVQAAVESDDIDVLVSGVYDDSHWAWDMGIDKTLFLGSNGAIVQGAVNGAAVARVGTALAPGRILLRIEPPILTA